LLIVLDTNILVSGLLSPNGPPGRILDLVLAGTIQLAYDDRIMDEYVRILSRRKFGFDNRDVRAVIDYFIGTGVQVSGTPLAPPDVPDPSDVAFAEVALASGADALVTGNQRDFAFARAYGVVVLSPGQLMERLAR